MNKCNTCGWWKRQLDNGGICKKKAPIVVAEYGKLILTIWPPVEDDDYCGDHTDEYK
jgi:hypothetical protein